MNDAAVRRREALRQTVLGELVHQEADGSLVHAVDGFGGAHEAVLRLQHQPVAAERHDHVGLLRIDAAVALAEGGGGLWALGLPLAMNAIVLTGRAARELSSLDAPSSAT